MDPLAFLKQTSSAVTHSGQDEIGPLYPGSTWCGSQTNGRKSYGVRVTILSVDTKNSTLSGYLSIRGLTKDIEELTTFFEGEILGLPTGDGLHETDTLNSGADKGVGFLTHDWATEAEDQKHWSRFPAFLPFKQNAATSHSVLPEKYKFDPTKPNGKHIFMRWKERFVVPDHKMKDIRGASYEGFYYVCVSFERPPRPPRPPRLQKSVSSFTIPSSPPPFPRSASMSPTRPAVRLPQTTVTNRPAATATPITFNPAPQRPTFSYAAALRRNSVSSATTPPVNPIRSRAQSHSAIRPVFANPLPPAEFNAPSEVGSPPSRYTETIVEDMDEQSGKMEELADSMARSSFSLSEQDFPPPLASPSPSSSPSLPVYEPRARTMSQCSTTADEKKEEKPVHFPSDPFLDEEDLNDADGTWKFASMTGFYYHAMSEPFQELKLNFTNGNRSFLALA